MTAFDRRAGRTAERLIERFGAPATLRRVTRSYDPVTGEAGEITEDHAVTVSPPETFREDLIDGTLVRRGDLKTHLAATTAPVVPEATGDRLILSATTYEVLAVEPVMSGAVVAYYTLHLRS